MTWKEILTFRTTAISLLGDENNAEYNKSKFGMMLIDKIRETDEIIRQYRKELNVLSLMYASETDGIVKTRTEDHEIYGMYYHSKKDLTNYLKQLDELDKKWEEKEFNIIQLLIPNSNVPNIPDSWKKDINPFIRVNDTNNIPEPVTQE